jgi:hypothetical protein
VECRVRLRCGPSATGVFLPRLRARLGLAIQDDVVIVYNMLGVLRPFLILVAVFAVAANSAGGAGASVGVVSADPEQSNVHRMHHDESGLNDEQGAKEFDRQAECARSVDHSCDATHHPGNATDSCCEMACHDALGDFRNAAGISSPYMMVDCPGLAAGVKEAPAPSLDRPPRPRAT